MGRKSKWRQKYEALLAKLNLELETAVDRRNQHLNEANNLLTQINHIKQLIQTIEEEEPHEATG